MLSIFLLWIFLRFVEIPSVLQAVLRTMASTSRPEVAVWRSSWLRMHMDEITQRLVFLSAETLPGISRRDYIGELCELARACVSTRVCRLGNLSNRVCTLRSNLLHHFRYDIEMDIFSALIYSPLSKVGSSRYSNNLSSALESLDKFSLFGDPFVIAMFNRSKILRMLLDNLSTSGISIERIRIIKEECLFHATRAGHIDSVSLYSMTYGLPMTLQ
jgi:hypothetical protein